MVYNARPEANFWELKITLTIIMGYKEDVSVDIFHYGYDLVLEIYFNFGR